MMIIGDVKELNSLIKRDRWECSGAACSDVMVPADGHSGSLCRANLSAVCQPADTRPCARLPLSLCPKSFSCTNHHVRHVLAQAVEDEKPAARGLWHMACTLTGINRCTTIGTCAKP